MRIVAITRIKDEVDIVEAFIRHTAWFVDYHILIDNGSIDGTLEILKKLHAEGLPIWVFRNSMPMFTVEKYFMNALLRLARSMGHADWVVPVDTDEFLDLREGVPSLRAVLEEIDPAAPGIAIPSVIYSPRNDDPAGEANVALRITHRWDPIPEVQKVIVRVDDESLRRRTLGPGNHALLADGDEVPLPLSADVKVAHFYRRTVAQEALKAVLGRLRAMSCPDGAECGHYQLMYDRVKDDPLLWLLGPSGDHSRPMVRDPIAYRGTPLVHTPPGDDSPARFIRALIAHGELQAKMQRELWQMLDPDRSILARGMAKLEPVL